MKTADCLGECMEHAEIGCPDGHYDACGMAWNPHPSFQGVEMKHLVRGASTEGRLSCHMVRVAPGCTLETHVHEGQWELHEVMHGSGRAEVSGKGMDYRPGSVNVIPMGTAHRVQAGDDGLWLLAKFFPALL
ncbi:cupin domain-containing protein [Nitratidesulfovibrio sp.]|uniref:cupin domain-containing protein n=1 Tax=Nitratidesulfovibrio sp. TaxID=2802297 RepID=UPI003340FDC3